MREVEWYEPPTPAAYERTTKVTCQFCGKEAPSPNNSGIWAFRSSDIELVELRREKGESWPECGSKETEFYDCCPACWGTKIKPVLDSLLLAGETINTAVADW